MSRELWYVRNKLRIEGKKKKKPSSSDEKLNEALGWQTLSRQLEKPPRERNILWVPG
jgi:hypothetical protein